MHVSPRESLFGLCLIATGILLTSCFDSGEPQFESKHFEFAKDADSLHRKSVIQPVPDTVGGPMIYYCRSGVYRGRQVVLKSIGPRFLITHAYGVTEDRTVWNVELPDTNYTAEVIVPTRDPDSVKQGLRRAINEEWGLAPTFVERRAKVLKLEVAEGASIGFSPSDAWIPRKRLSVGAGELSGQNIKLSSLRPRLSDVPALEDRVIVQEVTSDQQYDIDLQWKEGSLMALRDTLRHYGFRLRPADEKVRMLLVKRASGKDTVTAERKK